MARTTYNGYIRQRGTDSRQNSTATPGVSLLAVQISFDPTAASASTGVTLPKGAIPVGVQNLTGGATGGTNPTVDVGTSGTAAAFANELDADAIGAITATGSALGTALTADTLIYAGVGASAATGGTVVAAVYYIMDDDGTTYGTRTA